ncbi:MAG: hypothetical protein HYX61_07020 [Gammaproteobacteria bacterium]|jgi:hypothetical protein|nr:hypothetical protein [Gammaproteobacteria bacterium]
MKRLFILVPDLKETSDIAHELETQGVKESDIHVHAHIPQEVSAVNLHPANIFQLTNLGSAIKLGPILGLIFSAFILMFCSFVFGPTIQIHALGYFAILVFGVGFGIWSTGLIGLGVKNPVVEKYEGYVSDGHYLMMIDTADEREKEISSKIISAHPDTSLAVANDSVH